MYGARGFAHVYFLDPFFIIATRSMACPPACVSLIPVGVEVQLSRNPANSTTDQAGMYSDATPIIPKGYMWSCPGRSPDQSRSWPRQETVTQVSTEEEEEEEEDLFVFNDTIE